MANKSIFGSLAGKLPKVTNATNEAGSKAYQLSATAALAQYAITGCINDTFYASADTQLETVLRLLNKVEPRNIAKIAVYARQEGYMKDMPALLVAYLAATGADEFAPTFAEVIDNGRMLRNFVQIMRSGVLGRKSLGTRPKRLVQTWLNNATDKQLINASVGQSPSLADVIKMVHPKPKDALRDNLFAYLIGRDYRFDWLPEALQQLEVAKHQPQSVAGGEVPNVPFQLLTALDLGTQAWTTIARNAPWQMTRMNLNTFARHGVFDDPAMVERIAARLRNPELIAKAKVFPYQIMTAFKQADPKVPEAVRAALREAMEIALHNVPALPGKVAVLVDVSGSMQMSATGYRPGATSVVTCVDVAALVASALLAKNDDTMVFPFDTRVRNVNISAKVPVLENAQRLAISGGGTDCSAPLKHMNQKKLDADLVIFVSDNESWADRYYGQGTGKMAQWQKFKVRNPNAKLVCIDIQPYETVQAVGDDVLHVGGFSDAVFNVIAQFASTTGGDHWLQQLGIDAPMT